MVCRKKRFLFFLFLRRRRWFRKCIPNVLIGAAAVNFSSSGHYMRREAYQFGGQLRGSTYERNGSRCARRQSVGYRRQITWLYALYLLFCFVISSHPRASGIFLLFFSLFSCAFHYISIRHRGFLLLFFFYTKLRMASNHNFVFVSLLVSKNGKIERKRRRKTNNQVVFLPSISKMEKLTRYDLSWMYHVDLKGSCPLSRHKSAVAAVARIQLYLHGLIFFRGLVSSVSITQRPRATAFFLLLTMMTAISLGISTLRQRAIHIQFSTQRNSQATLIRALDLRWLSSSSIVPQVSVCW